MSNPSETKIEETITPYQEFVDSLPSLVWISDKNAKPTYFNKTWLSYTGKKNNSDCKKAWKKLIFEDDLKYHQEIHKSAHEQQKGYELKYRLWNEEEQKYRWIKEIGEPRFKNDKFLGFVTNSSDIQEHYDLIVNLSESENRYKELYNKTPVMMHSINSEGRFTSVSDYWVEKMGYIRSEVQGLFSTDLLTDESKDIARKTAIPTLMSEGKISNQSLKFVKKNGEIMSVLLSAVAEYDKNNKFVNALAVINDVTDVKKTDDFLKKVYQIISAPQIKMGDKINKVLEVASVFLGTSVGIVSKIDEDNEQYTIKYLHAPDTDYAVGQLHSLKDVFCKNVIPHDEIKCWYNLASPENQKLYGKPTDFKSYIGMSLIVDQKKYGTLCFYGPESRAEDFGEREKAIIQLIANWISNTISILKLIQELQNSEGELEELVTELQESNNELERFAYVAAHDLQEPIRSMRNFTSLLSKKMGDSADEDERQYMDIIHDAATRMQRLVADLLDYARLEYEGKTLEEVEVKDILDYISRNLLESIRANQGQLIYDIDLKIKTDPVKLSRLLQNLISNALKYCEDDIPPIVTITCEEKNNHWQFCVADNGLGIDKRFHQKIFAPFKRLHSKDKYSGSGIGLSICKKIAASLNGKLWVESEEGKGSQFFFTVSKAK